MKRSSFKILTTVGFLCSPKSQADVELFELTVVVFELFILRIELLR